MMCSKALNPNAEPFFLNKIRIYVCERPYYPPLPPFARINLHQPGILFCPWQQPFRQQSIGEAVALATNRVARKSAKGKRKPFERLDGDHHRLASCGVPKVVTIGEAAALATNRVARKSAKGKRKPFERLDGDHHRLASCGVPKVVTKKKDLQAKKWNTASCRPTKRSYVGSRRRGGRDVLPFPSNPDVQTTTIMIKNIPNQLQRADLLSFMSTHCCEENIKACINSDLTKSEFDFVYLPMDFDQYRYRKKISNLGYAFVNFTSAGAALRFYKKFHEKRWKGVYQNNKTREITCAKLQGLGALRGNFEKKTFRCHTDEYLPVILEPPCDGGAGHSNLITVGKRAWEHFGNPTVST